MIFRFVGERRDWLSRYVLGNQLEHLAKSAKERTVKDDTNLEAKENLQTRNQDDISNPPYIDMWFTNRMNKKKNLPPVSNNYPMENMNDENVPNGRKTFPPVSNNYPMRNRDDENVPNKRKTIKGKVPTNLQASSMQNWRGTAAEDAWYDALEEAVNDVGIEKPTSKLEKIFNTNEVGPGAPTCRSEEISGNNKEIGSDEPIGSLELNSKKIRS